MQKSRTLIGSSLANSSVNLPQTMSGESERAKDKKVHDMIKAPTFKQLKDEERQVENNRQMLVD